MFASLLRFMNWFSNWSFTVNNWWFCSTGYVHITLTTHTCLLSWSPFSSTISIPRNSFRSICCSCRSINFTFKMRQICLLELFKSSIPFAFFLSSNVIFFFFLNHLIWYIYHSINIQSLICITFFVFLESLFISQQISLSHIKWNSFFISQLIKWITY